MTAKRALAFAGGLLLLVLLFLMLWPEAETPGPAFVENAGAGAEAPTRAVLSDLESGVPRATVPSEAAVQSDEAAAAGLSGFEDVHLSLDAVELTGDASGLTLRVEEPDGLPVAGAKVVVCWRPGWGDYRYEYGRTDSRGELVCSAQEPFQIEDLDIWRDGSTLHLSNPGGGSVADPARPHVVRYRMPRLKDVVISVKDPSGAPVLNATVDIDGRETLSLEPDVNRLVVSRNYDPIPVDERGEVRVTLEDAAFEFEAEAEGPWLDADELVILPEREGSPVAVDLVVAPKPEVKPARPRIQREPYPTRRVAVHVVDALSGEGIGRAPVRILARPPFRMGNAKKYTSRRGDLILTPSVSKRREFVVAGGPGYAWAAVPLEPGAEDVELTLRLEPEQRIEGRAVTPEGAPVPGTAKLLAPKERLGLAAEVGRRFVPQAIATIGTGAPAKFHFNRVSSAVHEIRFSPEDGALPPVSVEARGGDKSVVIVVGETPPDLAVVEGTVTHRVTAEPVAGVRVILTSTVGSDQRSGVTDRGGRFKIAGLAPGDYSAVVKRPTGAADVGFIAVQVQEVTLPPGASTRNLEVSPSRRLSLLLQAGSPASPLRFVEVGVFDASGQPVELQDRAGHSRGQRTDTTWQGRADLQGIPAERVEIRVWLDPQAPRSQPADFTHWIDATAPSTDLIELRF